MSVCSVCGSTGGYNYTCNYCGQTHCSDHRLPENHQCYSVDQIETEGILESAGPDTQANVGRTGSKGMAASVKPLSSAVPDYESTTANTILGLLLMPIIAIWIIGAAIWNHKLIFLLIVGGILALVATGIVQVPWSIPIP